MFGHEYIYLVQKAAVIHCKYVYRMILSTSIAVVLIARSIHDGVRCMLAKVRVGKRQGMM